MTDRTEKPVADTPEVAEKPRRRTFEAAYRLRIVEEADRCVEPGQIGELLRREGLYSSHLSKWRRQRDEGALNGLRSKKRGRKAKPRESAMAKELERVLREKEEISAMPRPKRPMPSRSSKTRAISRRPNSR